MLIPEASISAQLVDMAFKRVLWMEVAFLVCVTAVMVFFIFRYHRRRNTVPESIEGSTVLEVTWTVIPTLLVLGIFYLGLIGFDAIRAVPQEVMVIKVMGRQWSWLFTYENGKESGVLRMPVKKPVKLLLSSQDVIHSFYVPAFRIKEDCVPRMETYLSITAEQPGEFDIFCTEYCGLGHSGMVSKVVAMEERDFQAWYAAAPGKAKERGGKSGKELLDEKGCLGCHTTDGTARIGPTFKRLYGSTVIVSTNGKQRTVKADEEYLRRSIREPKADVVKGFPDIMPTIPIAPEDLDAIVEYLETLR